VQLCRAHTRTVQRYRPGCTHTGPHDTRLSTLTSRVHGRGRVPICAAGSRSASGLCVWQAPGAPLTPRPSGPWLAVARFFRASLLPLRLSHTRRGQSAQDPRPDQRSALALQDTVATPKAESVRTFAFPTLPPLTSQPRNEHLRPPPPRPSVCHNGTPPSPASALDSLLLYRPGGCLLHVAPVSARASARSGLTPRQSPPSG
jgi:hypothetical protein